ncbi:MAG: hypothetical protein U0R17_02230 [Acidimicrobiia bacterium]
MKTIKIIPVVALTLALGLALYGCGNDKKDQSSSKKQTKAQVKKNETTSTAASSTMNTVQSSTPMNSSGEGQYTIDTNKPVPSVTIEVLKDAKMGYNLVIKTKNFKFTPQNVNDEQESQNEGHAHLYVNDQKITRVYGNYYYLKSDVVKPGDKVSVSLNTNLHKNLVSSEPVTAQ